LEGTAARHRASLEQPCETGFQEELVIRKTAVMVIEEHEKECQRCLPMAATQSTGQRQKRTERIVLLLAIAVAGLVILLVLQVNPEAVRLLIRLLAMVVH
jgi:hypothetical protein